MATPVSASALPNPLSDLVRSQNGYARQNYDSHHDSCHQYTPRAPHHHSHSPSSASIRVRRRFGHRGKVNLTVPLSHHKTQSLEPFKPPSSSSSSSSSPPPSPSCDSTFGIRHLASLCWHLNLFEKYTPVHIRYCCCSECAMGGPRHGSRRSGSDQAQPSLGIGV